MGNKKELTSAAIGGDLDKVKALLADGVKMQKSILQQTIFSGWQQPDVSMLDFLIGAGADPNSTAKGTTPLHEAAAVGPFPSRALAATDLLLRAGANPNVQSRGESPLHVAVATIADKTTARLIEGGADVNARTGEGDTPVHVAAAHFFEFIYHDGELVEDEIDNATGYVLAHLRHLQKGGADFSLRNEAGNTALGQNILRPKFAVEIAEFLLDAGSPVDDVVRVSETDEVSLVAAAFLSEYPSSIMVKLVAGGADATVAREMFKGMSLVSVAATQDPKLAIALCQAKPELLQYRSTKDYTLLHFSMVGGDEEFIRFLLERGLDKEAVSEDGETALQFAEANELPGAEVLRAG